MRVLHHGERFTGWVCRVAMASGEPEQTYDLFWEPGKCECDDGPHVMVARAFRFCGFCWNEWEGEQGYVKLGDWGAHEFAHEWDVP